MHAHQPPWRNWLARSAVNRKVGGSSPPGGVDTNFSHLGMQNIIAAFIYRFNDDS